MLGLGKNKDKQEQEAEKARAKEEVEHRDERETIEAKERRRGVEDTENPDSPTDLPGTSRKETLKRTFKEFQNDQLTDSAAALTYYGVLALFPALIALVSILGLIGPSATDPLLENVRDVAPGPARDVLTSAIEGIANSRGAAGVTFVIGLVLALNSASGYIGAFARASNQIYEVEEGRPVWKLKPQQIGITLVLILLLVVTTGIVAVTGPLAREVGNLIGLGGTAVTVWDIAKWPVLLVIVSFMFAFLFWASPNVKQPGFKWISPGGIVAVVLLIIASALFALYVANFASYNKTYGSLGGIIAFLVWLWIANVALLFGAEFNAELQRSQQIEAGHDAPMDEPFLEPRDTKKLEG